MKLDRKLQKETCIVFCFCLLIMLAVYNIMLAKRFCSDAFSDYYMEQSLENFVWNLKNGRLGRAVTEAIIYYCGINTVSIQLPFTLGLITVIAWCCTDLWALVISSIPEADNRLKGLALLGILPAFINISIGEFFFFANVAVHWIGLLLAGQLALRCFFAGNRVRNRLGAILLLYLSLSFYQAGIGYFLIWGFFLAMLRGGFSADRKTLLSLLWVLIVGAVASFASFSTQKLLEITGVISRAARVPSLNVFDNLLYLVSVGQAQILLDGMHFYGPVLGLIVACLTLGVLSCCFMRIGKKVSVWLILLLTAGAYFVSFAPHALTETIWLAPRTLYSLFSFLSFCALTVLWFYSQQKTKSRILPAWLAALLAVFLLVSARGIYTIGLEQIRLNLADQYEAKAILRKVAEYEQTSGQTIDKLGFVRDSTTVWTKPEAPNAYMDINVRSGAIDWQIPTILSYYRGSSFDVVEVPVEIQAEHFDGHEWDSFVPDEQIVFAEDTIYLCVY